MMSVAADDEEIVQREPITGGINADGPFWDHLERGEFRLPRCAGCGRWMWPAHFRCGSCGSWDQEWVPRPLEGTIYSWTRTWYVFDRTQERADDLPYVVLLVEIPDTDGARVLGVLEASDEDLRIGAPVVGSVKAPSAKSKGYPSIVWAIGEQAGRGEVA